MRTIRRSLATVGALALTMALHAGCATAAPRGVVYVAAGPPPARVDVRGIAPGPNYVWIAGSYRWTAGRYHWVPGAWAARPRAGAVWVAGSWRHSRRGHYWVPGHWR